MNPSPLILDSSALIAIAQQEYGATVAFDAMREARGLAGAFIHGANVCEVAYKLILNKYPPAFAWAAARPPGVNQIDDIQGQIGKRAVAIKVGAPLLSLADCLALSLAESLKGRVLTSDRHFANAGSCAEIVFFRS